VCIDTNVLISYLLAPGSTRPPSAIVAAAFEGRYSLVIARPTITELGDKVSRKPYLSQRISRPRLDAFAIALTRIAEVVAIPDTLPRVTRDNRDDYLLAPAVIEAVDYVVTGDKDLLVLGAVAGVRIVSPAGFVAILDQSPE
jgi:putative PIN family toxin of toxin-antitoxin system